MEAVDVQVGGGVLHLGPDVAVDGLAAMLDPPAARPHGLHRRLHRRVRLKHCIRKKFTKIFEFSLIKAVRSFRELRVKQTAFMRGLTGNFGLMGAGNCNKTRPPNSIYFLAEPSPK